MLSVLFKRGTITAHKMHWARPLQRSWISALARVHGNGTSSLYPCWASASALYCCTHAALRRSKTSAIVDVRTECVQGTRGWVNGLGHTQPLHTSAGRPKKRQPPAPPPRELDLLRYDMKDLRKSPKPALYLGFAGLIPFVSPPLLMAVTEVYLPELAYLQVAYGAAIVSFLGGARWGFALPESSPAKPDWINLANGVVPSLFAWVAMMLSDSITPAATLVIMGLGISLHYDLSLLPTYPSWFKAMRAILTVVAFLSLLSTLTLKGIYSENVFSN